MDKDQKLFVTACKKILRHEYAMYRQDAMEARQQAMNDEPCELKKENKGKQAGNLVLLEAIREFGITNWRAYMEGNQQPIKPSGSGIKPRMQSPKNPNPGKLEAMLDEAEARVKKPR